MKLENRQRGWKAKRVGSQLEVLFYNACARHQDFGISHIPQGGKQISKTSFKRVSTEFDFVVTHNGVTAMLDTKNIDDDHVVPSDIKRHQLNGIVKHIKAGGRGGYIVNLAKLDQVYFFPGQRLVECFEGHGNLLPDKDGFAMGTSYQIDPMRIFSVPILSCHDKYGWQRWGLPTPIR